MHADDALLYSLNYHGYGLWGEKSMGEIRKALSAKPQMDFEREGHHYVEVSKAKSKQNAENNDEAVACYW